MLDGYRLEEIKPDSNDSKRISDLRARMDKLAGKNWKEVYRSLIGERATDIASALGFTTKDVEEDLKRNGFRLDKGKLAFIYKRHEIFDAVVNYSRKDGGVLSTSRTGRRSSTPRDFQYESIVAKLTAQPSNDNQLSLGYNLDKTGQWSGPVSDRADYGLKQHRITGSWKYRSGDLIDIRSNVQYVKMENSFDGRSYNPNAYFSDDYESLSGNLQNTSIFQL